MTKLKLGPLPNRVPVKLAVSFTPEVYEMLEDYARVFEQVHGVKENVESLVSYMVEAFIKGDSGFKKAAREMKADSSF